MNQTGQRLSGLRREHPIFFWGMLAVVIGLLAATTVVAARIPDYRQDAALLDERMSADERATRDRILESRSTRAELAIALLRRELQLKSMQEKEIHLALSLDDSTLYLRHGSATLRQVRVRIGPDSVIEGPNGRTWRFVRALGERHVQEKQTSPTYLIPDWVYVSRGEPVPSESERLVEGGLGKYVLRLDDGTEIYSEPQTGPLAGQVKPASFMAPEGDLHAIFEAIGRETPVYIY
ncbi:MAG TPA: hypothetical protein VGR27_08850 [Longimicrobiaceae bacterium]|nr:hypothetical protein [Longimicrobiaceae bacterium]